MSEIKLTPVNSSQLHAIGFDPATGTLAIQFKGKGGVPGSLYHYANFTAAQFADFEKAESKGSFFGAHLKRETTKYPYKKIEPPKQAA